MPTPTAAPAADAGKKNDKQPAKPVWEGVTLVPVAGAKNPLRLSRSFVAPAGSYDVYVVAKELPGEKAPKNVAPKTVVLKQTVNVPDFWNSDLTTSSVILADRIDPLAAPLSQTQLVERPYAALGVMEIFPTASSKLSKKSELSVFFLIYNPKPDSAQKPDINIEYNFCQAAPGNQPKPDEPCKAGEKFYNKTDPQVMNAQTLPPGLSISAWAISSRRDRPCRWPVSRRRLPAGNQGDRQAREQVGHPGREFQRQRVVSGSNRGRGTGKARE